MVGGRGDERYVGVEQAVAVEHDQRRLSVAEVPGVVEETERGGVRAVDQPTLRPHRTPVGVRARAHVLVPELHRAEGDRAGEHEREDHRRGRGQQPRRRPPPGRRPPSGPVAHPQRQRAGRDEIADQDGLQHLVEVVLGRPDRGLLVQPGQEGDDGDRRGRPGQHLKPGKPAQRGHQQAGRRERRDEQERPLGYGHDEAVQGELLTGVEVEEQRRYDQGQRRDRPGDHQHGEGRPAVPPEPAPVHHHADQRGHPDQRQEQGVREPDRDHERGGEQKLLADPGRGPGEYGDRERQERQRQYLRVERLPDQGRHDAGTQPRGHCRADQHGTPPAQPGARRPPGRPSGGQHEEGVPDQDVPVVVHEYGQPRGRVPAGDEGLDQRVQVVHSAGVRPPGALVDDRTGPVEVEERVPADPPDRVEQGGVPHPVPVDRRVREVLGRRTAQGRQGHDQTGGRGTGEQDQVRAAQPQRKLWPAAQGQAGEHQYGQCAAGHRYRCQAPRPHREHQPGGDEQAGQRPGGGYQAVQQGTPGPQQRCRAGQQHDEHERVEPDQVGQDRQDPGTGEQRHGDRVPPGRAREGSQWRARTRAILGYGSLRPAVDCHR